jgi:CubicO group peptidase (beta-lactamase class C family)
MPEQGVAELERIARDAQADGRLPSLSAAAFRRGKVLWQLAIGVADAETGEQATSEHQYRVASITKTFVAASIFQLRDAGLLDLEDPLARHVPEAAHGEPTLRRMLSHLSGLQREPPGEIWETLKAPSREELLEGLPEAEQVLPPHEAWHYSNLAYALLGEVVARVSGTELERYVERSLLEPLGLGYTGWEPIRPARGYYVEPYSDAVSLEGQMSMGGTNAAGGLWSTTDDLARWGSFLAEPNGDVLSAESARQMHVLQTLVDAESWTSGHGLGLQLWRRGERTYAGHTGGFPGYVSIVAWSPKERAGVVLLTNSGSWPKLGETGLRLAETVLDELPAEPEAWGPGERPPEQVEELLGRWWSEGSEFVFSWHEGRLEARTVEPSVLPPAVFEPDGPDRWRTVSGRERGELLRAVRDDEGTLVKLYWATYPFTRAPASFAATGAPAPVEEHEGG